MGVFRVEIRVVAGAAAGGVLGLRLWMRSAMHNASSVGGGGDAPVARTQSSGDGKEEARPRLGDDNMGRGERVLAACLQGAQHGTGKRSGFSFFFVIGFRIWIIY